MHAERAMAKMMAMGIIAAGVLLAGVFVWWVWTAWSHGWYAASSTRQAHQER